MIKDKILTQKVRNLWLYRSLQKYYHKISRLFSNKYNSYNLFPEKNVFGKNVKLYNTIWGRGSSANDSCEIANTIIGNYTQFGENVVIGARNHIHTNFTIGDFIYSNEEFLQTRGSGMYDGYFNKVGHNVWVGRNCIINQGVEIGSHSIVAAGSVVTKSVPPYAMVGGNPAKIIKYKYDADTILELEKTKWYELNQESICLMRFKLEEIIGFDMNDYK